MIKKSLNKGRVIALLILSGGLSLVHETASATVADGVYAYEKGNYAVARSEWLPYAALGNPNALYNLGQLYRMGRGVDTDYLKAREYYLRAAEKGHVGAQRNLGTLYYFGRTGKVDHKQALEWLTKAAINQDARSQLMVGIMYYNGEAGQKDYIQAYAWITLAAKGGLGKAKATLDKLEDIMTSAQIAEARKMAPTLTSRKLSPDDVGLMIKQPASNDLPDSPEVIKPAPPSAATETKKAAETPPVVHVVTAEADNYRVQLGSYRTEDSARQGLKTLKKKLEDIIGDRQDNIEFADLGTRGIFYRLQLGPFESRANANKFCAELKENGQNCYSVKTP